ncbi:MAG: glycosyltransferase family 4 protein, partial [Actinomycetota bacterium]
MRSPSSAPPAGRLAIVHEWIASRAGSEKVFERLALALPSEADLIALTADPSVELDTSDRELIVTSLDRPALRKNRAAALPLMPLAWKQLAGRRKYDTIVTSSHAFAREFAHAQPSATHLCYVHSPMRYAW